MDPTRQKAKNWCFTTNNPAEELMIDDDRLIYACWQLESGLNGTPHYQGMAMFTDRLYLNQVRLIIPESHLSVMKGTPKQARDYCMKEDTRIGFPYELGIWDEKKKSGERTDLHELLARLQSGTPLDDVTYAEQFFGQWVKYPDLVARWYDLHIPERDPDQAVQTILIIGAPGLGKSKYAHSQSRLRGLDVFSKQPGKWWDGYRGHRVAVFDDFRGNSLSFTDFKRVFDRYPLRVEVKGGYRNLATTDHYITTNTNPLEWWKDEVTADEKEAIARRFTKVLWFYAPDTFQEFPTFQSYLNFMTAPPQVVTGYQNVSQI